MIGRIASALGLSSTAVLGWYLLVLVAALGAGAAGGGYIVHRYDATACDLRIAAQTAVYGRALQDQTDGTLEQERQDRANATRLEEAYAEQTKAREAAQADAGRARDDLKLALDRLRRIGPAQGGGSLPTAALDAGRCDDISAARDRAVAALERLVAGGEDIVADGQVGVDVATIAAQAAKTYGAAGR